MPERHGPGGEWRWRRRLPSAKQLSGRSGICRVHPVQASQGMASSRQLSGDINGAGVRCPAQLIRAGACWRFRNGPINRASVGRTMHPGMKQSQQNEQVTPVLAAAGWRAASFRIRTADGWLQVDGIVRPPFGIDQRATDKTGNRSWFMTHLPGRDLAGQGVEGGRRSGGSPH